MQTWTGQRGPTSGRNNPLESDCQVQSVNSGDDEEQMCPLSCTTAESEGGHAQQKHAHCLLHLAEWI